MKEKTSKFVTDDWIKAYEEQVQRATGYTNYSVKTSSIPMFLKLESFYPDVNPYLFMEAVFPPYCTWRVKRRRGTGYRSIPYPYPNMLVSKYAEDSYHRHLRRGIKNVRSREESILEEVKSSVEKLTVLQIKFTEYDHIYDLYEDGMISSFFLIMLHGFMTWLAAQTRKKKIKFEKYSELMKKREVLLKYNGLQKKIKEIIERGE